MYIKRFCSFSMNFQTSLFWLLCIVPIFSLIQNAKGFNLSKFAVSEDENNNCTKLSPNQTRTTVAGENELNILDLLNGGSKKMASLLNTATYPEDVILILGNTGSGKTTLTQILATNMSGLQAVETQSGQLVIIDNQERIGAPGFLSRTLVPELVTLSTKDNQTIYFYDCPGFDDTRGPEQDLAANYYIHQILKNVKRVKMLFLVTSSSMTLGNRLDFDLLATHATRFVKNLTLFENSIGLVVTKVKSLSYSGGPVTDTKILIKILEFLCKYNQTLYDASVLEQNSAKKDTILRKLEFVQILMKMQGEDISGFTHISFSRSPVKCGPLSNSPKALGTQARVTKMYENLEYGLVGQANSTFGYTLKYSTVAHIQNYSRLIDQKVGESVKQTLSQFMKWFDKNKFPENGDFAGIKASVEYSLELVNKFLLNSTDDLLQFGESLEQTLEKIGYSVPKEFTEQIRSQAEYFNFFESVVGVEIRKVTTEWKAPFSKIQKKFETYLDWYKFLLNTKNKLVSYELHRSNISLPDDDRNVEINWLEFLERNNIVYVENHEKELILQFGTQNKHAKALGNVIQWALQPTRVSCTEQGKKVRVTGNLIKVSDFVDSSGNLKGECRGAKDLVIFASNTVFLDVNINGKGKEMSVVIIAPNWQVIGSPSFNLEGGNAEHISPNKAQSGHGNGHHGENGEAGKPGNPGGPGGVFLGIAEQILMPERLTISVNGGNGGNGQHGGDGASGKDGREIEFFIDDLNYGVYWRDQWGYEGEPGGDGGNGGNGGVGGLGGNPGKIEIISKDSCKVNLVRQRGLNGSEGVGGSWGKGGIGSKHVWCNKHTYFGRFDYDSCTTDDPVNGDHGRRGEDGANYFGFKLPPQARMFPYANLFSYRFMKLYENESDKETLNFLKWLLINGTGDSDNVPCSVS